MAFGRPNVEIGRKIANGRLLFLALVYMYEQVYVYNFGINVNVFAQTEHLQSVLI